MLKVNPFKKFMENLMILNYPKQSLTLGSNFNYWETFMSGKIISSIGSICPVKINHKNCIQMHPSPLLRSAVRNLCIYLTLLPQLKECPWSSCLTTLALLALWTFDQRLYYPVLLQNPLFLSNRIMKAFMQVCSGLFFRQILSLSYNKICIKINDKKLSCFLFPFA